MNDQKLPQSIFDLIDERPKTFAWSKLPEELIHDRSEILYDNSLISFKSNGDSKTNRYVLTHQGLFKYKV